MQANLVRTAAVAVAACLAATGLVLSQRGEAPEAKAPSQTTTIPTPTPSRAQLLPRPADVAKLPTLDHWAVVPGAPLDPAPTKPTTGNTARLTADVIVYKAPAASALGMLRKVTLRDVTRVPVLDDTTHPGWVLVPLPVRRGLPSRLKGSPNGATGWIYLPGSGVILEKSHFEIVVDTKRYSMSIKKDGKPVKTWTVSIGTDANPTPTGVRTYIASAYAEPTYNYSRQLVYLSVFSPTLDSFDGGPAPSAIHGWFGEKVSQPIKVTDGCVRVPDDALSAVVALPIGTPVYIRAESPY